MKTLEQKMAQRTENFKRIIKQKFGKEYKFKLYRIYSTGQELSHYILETSKGKITVKPQEVE